MLVKFFNWFSKHFLCCREAARLISESCERPLSFTERAKLRILAFMCPYTARYKKQIDLLHEHAGQCGEGVPEKVQGACMSDECKQRLKEKLAGGA